MNMPKRASCHHRRRSACAAASADAVLAGEVAATGTSAAREPAAYAAIPPMRPSCFKNERRSSSFIEYSLNRNVAVERLGQYTSPYMTNFIKCPGHLVTGAALGRSAAEVEGFAS